MLDAVIAIAGQQVDGQALEAQRQALEAAVAELERAVLELLTGGTRELARRLEQTEVALSAYLPTP